MWLCVCPLLQLWNEGRHKGTHDALHLPVEYKCTTVTRDRLCIFTGFLPLLPLPWNICHETACLHAVLVGYCKSAPALTTPTCQMVRLVRSTDLHICCATQGSHVTNRWPCEIAHAVVEEHCHLCLMHTAVSCYPNITWGTTAIRLCAVRGSLLMVCQNHAEYSTCACSTFACCDEHLRVT